MNPRLSHRLVFVLLLAVTACLPSLEEPDTDADADSDTDTDTDLGPDVDDDGDGFTENQGDCDDADADIFTGAVSDHEGISMAFICPGGFVMGSPSTEVGRSSNESSHKVELTRGYYIGVYEVTQDQFDGFVGYDPSTHSGCGGCPAETMDWNEAAAFANEVSSEAGLAACYTCTGSGSSVTDCALASKYATPYDCVGYRLPTEAEWEFAARAGTAGAYAHGANLLSGDETNCDGSLVLGDKSVLDDFAVYCGNAYTTATVGSGDPNAWGLHDMNGNASEWCYDWWDLSGSDYDGDATDPYGETSSADFYYRLIRSGSWEDAPKDVRTSRRMAGQPDDDSSGLGLRLARSR